MGGNRRLRKGNRKHSNSTIEVDQKTWHEIEDGIKKIKEEIMSLRAKIGDSKDPHSVYRVALIAYLKALDYLGEK